jgi:hypothetical protein
VLGKTLGLRFPPFLDSRKVFRGPREGELLVTIVHAIEPDHPFVVGTLEDPDGRPIGNASFSIMGHSKGELLVAAGGKTDGRGRFMAYLSDRCAGQHLDALSLGMDWMGTGPAREVRVPMSGPMSGPLVGRIGLGRVVMREKK